MKVNKIDTYCAIKEKREKREKRQNEQISPEKR